MNDTSGADDGQSAKTAEGSFPPMPPVWAPAAPATSRRRMLAAAATLIGAFGLASVEWAVQEPAESWVWARFLFWHPMAVSVIVLVLLVVGLRLAIRSETPAVLAIAATLVIAVPLLGAAAMLSWSSADGPDERYASPDGGFEAVVDHESVHIMEPGAHVWIETQEGLLSRKWLAGCLDGDAPENGFESFRWVSPTAAEVRTVGGEVLPLSIDAATGRPLNRANSAGITTEYGCG